MRTAIIGDSTKATLDYFHGGEGRAVSSLVDLLAELSDECFLVGPGEPPENAHADVVFVNPGDVAAVEADILFVEGGLGQEGSDLHLMYTPLGVTEDVFNDLVARCSNRCLSVEWCLGSRGYNRPIDSRATGILAYAKQPEALPLVGIPIYEWVPFVPRIEEWVAPGQLSNIALWTGSMNAISEFHHWRLDDVFEAWKSVADHCDKWYLDLLRFHQAITGYTDRDTIEEVRQLIWDIPKLRAIPIYRYLDWLRYAARSSMFVCRYYTYTGQGQIEPPFLGTPSILQEHGHVHEDYPFLVDLDANPDTYARMFREFYDHYVRRVYSPRVEEARVEMMSRLRTVYSRQRSLTRLRKILEQVMGNV